MSDYPYQAGYAQGSDTSEEASIKLTDKSKICNYIISVMKEDRNGFIADDLRTKIEAKFERDFDRSTISARFCELEAMGLIVKTTEKRKTPKGRNAFVYIHRSYFF